MISYITYIYYNRDRGGLNCMGKYMLILMFLLIAIAVVFATYNLSIIRSYASWRAL